MEGEGAKEGPVVVNRCFSDNIIYIKTAAGRVMDEESETQFQRNNPSKTNQKNLKDRRER